MIFKTENHRTYTLTESLAGSRIGEGLIIADLYYADGTFYRSAVVADCGTYAGALRWLAARQTA